MVWVPLLLSLSYLLGSIPSGYIMGLLVRGVDVRQFGDRNMGAANTARVIGPCAGVVVGLADASKGALAVLIAGWSGASYAVVLLCGVAAVAGHNWPVFADFRGGRGEATVIGVLLVLLPLQTALLLGAAAIPLFTTWNIILASCVLFIPLPLVAWWMGASGALIGYSAALPCLVGITHFITTRRLPEADRRLAGTISHRGGDGKPHQ